MRSRFVLTSLTLLAALSGAAAALFARPSAGRAQDVQAAPMSAIGVGYQLAVLPTTPGQPREWLVLNTRTGEVEHWQERSDEYVVHHGLRPGKISTNFDRTRKHIAGR